MELFDVKQQFYTSAIQNSVVFTTKYIYNQKFSGFVFVSLIVVIEKVLKEKNLYCLIIEIDNCYI